MVLALPLHSKHFNSLRLWFGIREVRSSFVSS